MESQTGDPDEQVVVWASKDSRDPDKLKLILVNMKGTSQSVNIDVAGFTPRGGVYYALTNPNPTDLISSSVESGRTTINGASVDTRPGMVQASIDAIPARPVTGIDGQQVSYSLPPYSAVALVLQGSPETP